MSIGFKPANIPIIGQGLGRIGAVSRILATPCSPTPEIWVKAFFHGLPKLAVTLVKPSPLDQFTERRIGRQHGRKTKKLFKADDMVDPNPGGKKGFRWAVFGGFKLLERVGWYFLIFDAATTHTLNWVSMAYTYTGCDVPGSYGITGTTQDTGAISNFEEHPVMCTWSPSNKALSGSGNLITVNKGYGLMVTVQVAGEPFLFPGDPDMTGGLAQVIVRQVGGTGGEIGSDPDELDNQGRVAMVYDPIEMTTDTVRTVQVVFRKKGGPMKIIPGGKITATAFRKKGIINDP